ncbi:sigma-54-dependent Fis family transcriptional regulator [Bacillus sp. S/N-304-OC-R1]|uniref:sigma-54-dependent Fis family transcriptional regulator n=1 Tax=Bacillus sp. S/N-304-OC-R1 TaxID=2758034 RepID=UPI001C8D7A8B|nr:sigma-54-dependent Fis family transcriptional regulator [Bacillus sp. S/N-304-OC-R1]MBY0121444.1 sigma 54-interacting transcriptional regulator [Bacillus sp. S/N-304-OC-R1]
MSVKQLINEYNEPEFAEELFHVRNWMKPCLQCILASNTVREAGEILKKLNVNELPVIDESERFIGMVTTRKILADFLQGGNGDAYVGSALIDDVAAVKPTDSVFSAAAYPYDLLPVVNEHGKVVGILTARDAMDALFQMIHKLQKKQNSAEVLRIILESAYEGIAVVDENGILLEFNEAYSRFTGIPRKDAIGRHVTEVIDNTNLHVTVKTAIPERGVIQNIQGQDMVVHRIPIWNNGKVAGAIGMLIFEGVTEVYKLYETLQKNHIEDPSYNQSSFKAEAECEVTLDQILGVSDGIAEVKRLARRAARTSATVLITGESGTGKEMFAKSIHHLSPYSSGPFISINCGAIPEPLFESELFGYEEGAFTGAKRGGKQGKFELAKNGTIFLDEIGEMPLSMQTKLLRVLQEKEAERVGSVEKYQIHARIIAATNRNLLDLVRKGQFREDLYYRLNIIHLHIPPLRERKQDIPILLGYYLSSVSVKYGIPKKTLTSEAVSFLMQYKWRGNIREMVNMIERLVTLIDGGFINQSHLQEVMTEQKEDNDPNFVVREKCSVLLEAKNLGEQREIELITKILKEAGGNKSKAAQLLGIHRTTLYQKLKKYRIQ